MCFLFFVFFFNDTATTEIYTLSLHDALPISPAYCAAASCGNTAIANASTIGDNAKRYMSLLPEADGPDGRRSEEHSSELQSQSNLVCRLLLEKQKKKK